jgi:hypothetical protein
MDIFSTLYRLRVIPFLKKWNLLNFILGSIDILAITIAFQIAYLINYSHKGLLFITDRNLVLLFIGTLPVWLIILYIIKVTEIPRTKSYRVLFVEYLQSAIVLLFFLFLIYFIFTIETVSQLFILEFAVFGFLFLYIVRILEYKVFKTYRARGYNQINVVLIADDSSVKFIDNLLQNKEWGYKIFAIFTSSNLLKERYGKMLIFLPEKVLKVLYDLMEVDLIDQVIYVKKKINTDEVRQTARSCEELGVTFMLKLGNPKTNLTNAIKTDIAGEKFLTFINVPHNLYPLAVKKFMDIIISLTMIIILSPLLLIFIILIKVTSRGPVIFKQARVGLRGRQFNLYKFRTMVSNAEEIRKDLGDKNEADGPVFKIKDDPRITKIGKFLRKSGLDELPQLFNVLKGRNVTNRSTSATKERNNSV